MRGLGQRRRDVDLRLDGSEVILDLFRRYDAQPQACTERPNAKLHRGQAIQDAVGKASETATKQRLIPHCGPSEHRRAPLQFPVKAF